MFIFLQRLFKKKRKRRRERCIYCNGSRNLMGSIWSNRSIGKVCWDCSNKATRYENN